MGVRVFFLTLLRVLLFLISAATLGCHAAQIGLLGDTSWFPRNYSYILYFVGPGVSTISSIALLLVSVSSVKAIRGDRIFGIINAALMIAVVIVCTLKSGPVPWKSDSTEYHTGGPTTGFQNTCHSLSSTLLKNRCWLSNGAWMGSIVLAVFWIILSFFVFIHQRSDIYDDEDYEVYDFKNDIPMAITSNSPIIKHQQHQQPSPALPPHIINNNNNNNNNNNAVNHHDIYYDAPPQQPTPNYFDYGYQYHQQQQQYHQQQQQAVMDSSSSAYYYPQQIPYQQDNSSNYSPSPYKNTDETTHILQDTSLPDASANSSHASYTQSPHTPSATITDSKIKQVPHAY